MQIFIEQILFSILCPGIPNISAPETLYISGSVRDPRDPRYLWPSSRPVYIVPQFFAILDISGPVYIVRAYSRQPQTRISSLVLRCRISCIAKDVGPDILPQTSNRKQQTPMPTNIVSSYI